MTSTIDQIHDALGAYVVGALEPADHLAFERHLTTCPACRVEVVALDETAGRLGVLAAAPPPPSALRTAVLASLPDVRQLPAARPVATLEVARAVEPVTPAPVRPAPVHDAAGGRTDELARRRLARRTRVLSLLVAAVSVLALALGGVVVSLTHGQDAPVAGAPADASLLSAPDARILPVTLPDGTRASFVVSRSQNRALFVAQELPDPGPGKTYQLWRTRGATPYPDSTVGGGTEVSQWFHGSVSDAGGLAVTVEPTGGSRVPTTPVLASSTI